MQYVYPILIGELAKRGIKKNEIATKLKISERALYNKLYGVSSFTWEEICNISESFFPGVDKDTLFKKQIQNSA